MLLVRQDYSKIKTKIKIIFILLKLAKIILLIFSEII